MCNELLKENYFKSCDILSEGGESMNIKEMTDEEFNIYKAFISKQLELFNKTVLDMLPISNQASISSSFVNPTVSNNQNDPRHMRITMEVDFYSMNKETVILFQNLMEDLDEILIKTYER